MKLLLSNEQVDMLDYKWFSTFFQTNDASKNPTDPGTRIGPLSLGSLRLGDAREATVKELDLLDA